MIYWLSNFYLRYCYPFLTELESNAILIIHANRLTKGFLQEIRDAR